MGQAFFEIFLVFILLIINGLFSMSELSVVSARKIRLQQSADQGSNGAKTALSLAASPNNFLSTVQIGITLVGILSGAFGGASIAQALAFQLEKIPFIAPYSAGISFIVVIGIITYFSIIIGELLPKSIALAAPEKIAALVSIPMKLVSTLAAPVVWLLSAPTSVVLKLFKLHAVVEPPVTDEEIKGLIDAGTKAGVFEETEQDLLESVIHLGDREIPSLMTPRTGIFWIDLDDSPEKIREQLINTRFTRIPIGQGSLDKILGYATTKAVLGHVLKGNALDLRAVVQQPLYVPETITILELLEQFMGIHTPFAVVVDEFGGVEGLVTVNDVLKAIVGDLPGSQHSRPEQNLIQREDGSWILDGRLSVNDLKELLKVKELPLEKSDHYHTLAGFVISQLGKMPRKGDRFNWFGFSFEIILMDRNRVDQVLVSPFTTEQDESRPD